MAIWLEYALVGLLLCAGVHDVTVGQSLPADQVENAPPSLARGGQVAPGSGGVITLAEVEAAVRVDAGRFLKLVDPAALDIRVEELNWADGSLGCPRPGLSYTQALVPGWRLVVRHPQREAVVYHASRLGRWMLCPRPPAALPSSRNPVR
ncbi:MAG: hypothetical protein ACT6RP_12025 [Roseateles sp.]|uniref:hypothetical protein n=1 Tax=Roseateles sp. TaxID=1971397 RepID=UPI0040351966